MLKYTPTIGLEVHIIPKTETKMFCDCPNNPSELHPNVNVCPICLGHPGTLPTINKLAVEKVLALGLALNGKIASHSHFDRKSYFYPDLPKGYQISQYEEPLVTSAELLGVRVRRIHLEEDAGRLVHEKEAALVDFNRAGVPLIELVTEPDIKSAEEAVQFAKELQLILRYAGISEADMERGEMRVEANVSLDMGTKVELKNLNSFRAIREAIEYELERQAGLLGKGKKVEQETRGWNADKGISEPQRTKEEAQDYRYFPEPDLPPLDLTEFDLDSIRRNLVEMPAEKRERFKKEFGLDDSAVELLVEDPAGAGFFEEAASELKTYNLQPTNYHLLYNYFSTDLRGLMMDKGLGFDELKISPHNFAHLTALIVKGELSSRMAKDLLVEMLLTARDPESLIKEKGTRLIGDGEELTKVVEEVVKSNEKAVEDYKKGKTEALKFLTGQVMARTKGQAEPEAVKRALEKILGVNPAT